MYLESCTRAHFRDSDFESTHIPINAHLGFHCCACVLGSPSWCPTFPIMATQTSKKRKVRIRVHLLLGGMGVLLTVQLVIAMK